MAFKESGNFIGDFKLGDNIQFNLVAIQALYVAQRREKENPDCLSKPIIILLASIAEALLYDVFRRMRNFTKEGVANIAQQVLDHERKSERSKMGVLVDGALKHDIFDDSTGQIYVDLDELRQVRNRIHIQNADDKLDSDESAVFTMATQAKAERVVEQLVDFIAVRYPRPAHIDGYVGDLSFPWERRLSIKDRVMNKFGGRPPQTT